MAIYRIFPDKTATLYSRYPLFNTGLDEIMEVDSYYVGSTGYVARTAIAKIERVKIRFIVCP